MTVTGSLFIHSIKNARYFFRYHRKKLLIISLIITVFFTILAFSDRPDDWLEKPGFLNPLTFDYVDDITSGENAKEAADQVKVSFSEGSDVLEIGGHQVPGIASVVTPANDMCKGIAFLFMIMTFFLGLLSMRSREQMDEEFLRRLCMMILGLVLIVNAQKLSYLIVNVGSQLATNIATANMNNPDKASVAVEIKGKIYDDTHVEAYDHAEGGVDFVGPIDKMQTAMENFATSVSYDFSFFIPWLALKIAGIIVSVVIWGRALEIVLMATFSPLAFMEIPDIHHVGHGPGMRFIKSMVALAISGALIVFVLVVTSQVNIQLLSAIVSGEAKISDNLWALVILGFAQCGTILKASQLSRQVVGVG